MSWLVASSAAGVSPRIIEWITGATVPDDVGAASVVFERPLPTWAWFLVVVGACAIGWWSYRRLSGSQSAASRAMRGALALFRAAAIVLVALLIAGPSLRLERIRIERDRLVVLVDRSQSLAIEDGAAGRSRDAEMRGILANAEETLATIARDKDIDFAGFAGGVFSLGADAGADADAPLADGAAQRPRSMVPEIGEANGDRTDLDGALRQALARAAGRPVSGILLLSDGRSATPVSTETFRTLERDAIPVFAVPLGSGARVGDAAIISVAAPSRAFVRDRVPVEVRVDRGGVEGALTVRLVDAETGAELDAETVEADGGDGSNLGVRDEASEDGAPAESGVADETVVMLDMSATDAGRRSMRVEIAPARPDLVRENNARTVSVELVDRPIRVLYVEGSSRWEYRYLKNLLIREQDIESSVMLLSADRDFAQEGNMPIARLPRTAEEFGRYDLFVIGDVPGGFFSPEQLAIIRGEVSERGAGLLWIGGDRSTPSSWEGTPLADLLPFRPPLSLEARVGASMIRPTVAAERLGVLRLAETPTGWPETLVDRGLSWPKLRFVQSVPRARVKPTAEVIAQAESADALGEDPSAAVLRMRFGAGEIIYVATDEIWRWRYGQGERYPERFWVPLVRLLARESLAADGGGATLTVTPSRVTPGESVLVTLRLGDESAAEAAAQSLPLEIRGADGNPIARLDLVRDGADATASFPADRLGSFQAVATDPSFGSADAPFEVVRADDELRRGDADHEALAVLAARTKGRVLGAEAIEELPQLLPARAREIDESLLESLWDTPLAFGMLLVLLALEWTGRRLLRLV
ncbi:MAG: hypothetical protein GC172_11630 [Phycisphaera sp.]|nr:hypothetical protein [Phycisphaera sp.]